MIDGLALGETTPGPLIMVVTFVGFLGGWNQTVFGPEQVVAAGVLGATIVTYFTFLPSFLFILLGAPAVEATRQDLKLVAPLTAITAAVVGVIINLALFFAYHVLWPQGFEAGFEWPAALIGAAAFVALFVFRANIIWVIAGCALTGLVMGAVTGRTQSRGVSPMAEKILFMCPHNAAKSVIAIGYCRQLTERHKLDIMVDSAGTEPDTAIWASVSELLRQDGIDVSGEVPRLVTAEDLDEASRVVSLGCDIDALRVDTAKVEHWDVPLPSQDLQASRDAIRTRVESLIHELGDRRNL